MAETVNGGGRPPLDDLMMAMDVVDTLRHERAAVARELGQDDRDRALKARLREIYEGQGLAVTDEILEEGIAALRESRFTYTPPPPGWRRALARAWVGRMRWGPWAGATAALLVLWLGWQAVSPSEEARIAAGIADTAAAAEALSATNEARAAVVRARRDAETALTAGRLGEARDALDRLEAIEDRLAETYTIRLVSRPGERTGIERIPDVNEAARNLYLVVEAVGPDGRVMAREIESEETGRRKRVETFAVRVPAQTYHIVARDKQDDGVLQAPVLGEKRRGSLEVDWRMPVMGGTIVEW